MWFSPYHQDVGAIHESESDAMLAGRLVADVASILLGGTEVVTGGAGMAGGGSLCITGVGCIAGAPAIAASGALAIHGAGTGVRGAEGLGTTLALFSKRRNNEPTGKRPPWKNEKDKLIERDGPYCAYCNEKLPEIDLTIDHFEPWKKIKQDATTRTEEITVYRNIKNLVLSCKSCNSSKGAKNYLIWLERNLR